MNLSNITLTQLCKIINAFSLNTKFDISDISAAALVCPSIVYSVIVEAEKDGLIISCDNNEYKLTEYGVRLFKGDINGRRN